MRLSIVVLTVAASACTGAATAARPPQAAPPPVAVPLALHWLRGSAEYRAITLEVYRAAGDRLPAAAQGLEAGRWAVVLDADETILDNSEYQRRLVSAGQRFSETTWSAWVRERAAVLVPGAGDFVRRVRALGGRVAIVTNRADSLCAATRENLAALGVDADLVLCQPPGDSDKNPRFERIRNGTAAPGWGPLTVVEWVGDNIQDFPALTQTARDDPGALALFGVRYFALPNPMYGSWERTREP